VIMDQRRLIGVRDPKGLRPLCLGRLEAGWALASESCALDAIGAHRVRELAAGEVVVIDDGPPRSRHPFPASSVEPRLCLFEFVYIARPDSRLNGRSVYRARREAGARLAEQAPLPDDRRRWPREALVIPVPDSGIAAAEGFAHRSGLPLGSGLVRDRYVGRSFIVPAQTQREKRVRMKFAPLPEQVAGKRLVVVDDSIVRGTTMRALVAMLREAGASEVHLRIASPPYRWPCFFGVDTPIAHSSSLPIARMRRCATSSPATRSRASISTEPCAPPVPIRLASAQAASAAATRYRSARRRPFSDESAAAHIPPRKYRPPGLVQQNRSDQACSTRRIMPPPAPAST